MNPLTLVKRIQKLNSREADLGISEDASWHAKYKDSAYVFVGGIPYDLTEGDLLAIFAQYGELVDVNLVRDKASGKSKGFAFIAYEDQRSTNLAVDNLNGAQILGRTIRVDHVTKYKKKEEEDEEEERQKREERGVCRAFQKGECTRGAGCKFSHDEQRAANTGWGHEEDMADRQSRMGHGGGVCFAFQKGECTRGAGCKFSHDEQRAANTGRGHEEDRQSRMGHGKFEGGVCFAFQKGECTRGAGCKFSHDEQRAANTGGGHKEDRPQRTPIDIPSGRDRESSASARHKADELDVGRSRRRDGERYRKHSETDYKDREGRDRSRQLEGKEKVPHKEDRDTRGADRSSSRGLRESHAGEDYDRREDKRCRRHDMEEYHHRENRDEREREREKRSSHARDSSSLHIRDRDDDDHYRSRR